MTFARARAPRLLLTAVATAGVVAVAGATGAKTVSAANVACSADSLVSAVAAANGGTDGGVVNLAAGCTYTMTAVNNTADGANALPDITGTVTINGNGATITRSNSAPAFRFLIADNSGNLTINNLTLSNGQAEAQPHGGGAVLNRGHLSVTGVSFLNNSAPYDGSGAVGGGALDNHDGGNATVTRSTFTGNSAIEGGAIEDEATVGGHGLTVTQSTFTNNSTSNFGGVNGPFGGGGVENQLGGNDTLIGNTFIGNSAIEGAGIANAGTMTVTNNTLYNNHAGTNGGGGIQNYGNLTITQTTLSGNSSAGGGADLHTFNQPAPAAASVTTISQSIVANGVSSANCSGTGTITDSGYNLDDGTSCGFTAATGSMNNTNPQLATPKDNGGPTQTMAPDPNSAVVDAIPSANCSGTTDQRGATRPQGSGCDIGSVELVNQTASTTTVGAAPNPVAANQPVTYTATISPAATSGSVAFRDGGSAIAGCQSQPVSAGSASCTQTYGAAGSHSISAVFSGDIYHTGSTSSPVTETVTAPSPPPPGFSPQGVGAPKVALTPDGSSQLVFWKGSNNQLSEAWYSAGRWNGPISFPQFGTLTSDPAVAVTRDGRTQLVFWQGAGGHLFEAWYAGSWNGPVDWTAAWGGRGPLSSAPSVVTTSRGEQLVFWRGSNGHLWESWFTGVWNGPADFASFGTLGSAPSAAMTAGDSQQMVFWQSTDNRLMEVWYQGSWNGPVKWTGLGSVSSAPSVAVAPDGTQLVFYRSGSHLLESWYQGAWYGPADLTAAAFGGNGPLTSSPSAAVMPDNSQQLVFWQGPGATLWEAWFALGSWHGPVNFSAH